MPDRSIHEACVDRWLERTAATTLPRESTLDLFEAALRALWARARGTLGEVTLLAISRRVLHNAAEQYPEFAALEVEPTGRIETRGLRSLSDGLHHAKLVEAMRFVLVEFLTVLGRLTAELLTAEMHAELCGITPRLSVVPAARKPARTARTEIKDATG